MAGGNWDPASKPKLPGFYLNFEAEDIAAIAGGDRGTVICPVRAHWGPDKEFVEITSEATLIGTYTADVANSANAYDVVRLALMGGAKKVLAYRMVSAAAAAATKTLQDTGGVPTNVLKIDAKYKGARGNAFKVTVQDNAVDASKKDLKLYEGSTLLHTFTFADTDIDAAVAAINNDAENVWITATKLADGNDVLANVADQALAGGDSGIAGLVNADYTGAGGFLEKCQTQQFNVIVLDGQTDGGLQTSVKTWVKGRRDAGKGIIWVAGGADATDTGATAVADANSRSTGFDYEGVVNVGVGGKLDGVSYSSAFVACWVAGLIAGKKHYESIAYAKAPFEDVTRRWDEVTEQPLAMDAGTLLLIHDGEKVKVLSGINTLTTITATQNNQWKKVRAIRTMDALNADMLKYAEDYVIGKINNTPEGQLALIGVYQQYMATQASVGAILPDYKVYLDPDHHGDAPPIPAAADEIYMIWEASIADSAERIFGKFVVKSS